MLLPGEGPKRVVEALKNAQTPKLQTPETRRKELLSKEAARKEDASAE